MTSSALSPATMRLVDFLGELGGRWGNPPLPCRVHGYLFLAGRPLRENEICQALELDPDSLKEAMAWLEAFGLVESTTPELWLTDSDPWTVMMRALEERRRRELAPALQLLRDCRRESATDRSADRRVDMQVGKLLTLVEDLAAIDSQAGRLSPQRLRQIVRLGGKAARFLDRRL